MLAATVVYAVVIGFLAHRKLLWTDELATIYIATQPTFGAFLDSLLTGPDTLPPLSHLATRVSIALMGESHIAYRGPEGLGYLLGMFCVYLFLRPRHSRAAASTAVLVMVSVPALEYAYEARPYGLLVGFTGLSLLAWRRGLTSRTWVWPVVLAISTSAAIASHWYGVLIAVPIGIAEAVRLWSRRQFDARSLLALTCGLAIVPFLTPFAQQALTFRGFIPPPGSLSNFLWDTYALVAGSVLTVAALFIGLSSTLSLGRRGLERDETRGAELAAAIGTVLIPVFAFLLAHATSGQLTTRYAVHSVIGVALLAGMCFDALVANRRIHRAIGLAVMVALALINLGVRKELLSERSMVVEGEGHFALLRADLSGIAPEPIIVPSIHAFLQLQRYADQSLRGRLAYVGGFNPMETKTANALVGFDGAQVFNDLDVFLARYETFYIYEVPWASSYNPLLPSLIKRGAQVEDSGWIDDRNIYPRPGYLYRVTRPQTPD